MYGLNCNFINVINIIFSLTEKRLSPLDMLIDSISVCT